MSYKWRNNPVIWANTGSAPNCTVTEAMETDWMRKVLSDPTTKRFAICLKDSGQYIGNAYLSNIANGLAEEQIFIGEPELWSKGIGTKARTALYTIARNDFEVRRIVTNIRTRNIASLKSVQKLGFTEVSRDTEWVTLEKLLNKKV